MNPSEVVEIITFKNGKRTKKNLRVNRRATYDDLIVQVKQSFTSKQFKLEFRSQDGLSYKNITHANWRQVLDTYAGQEVHINTIQDKKVQEQKITNAVIGPIYQQIKSLANSKIRQRYFRVAPVNPVGKQCCQCNESICGVYYACLVCEQFIICGACEAKQTESELKNHKYRAHPFAKINRPEQELNLESKKIVTIRAEDVDLGVQNASRNEPVQQMGENEIKEKLRVLIQMHFPSIQNLITQL